VGVVVGLKFLRLVPVIVEAVIPWMAVLMLIGIARMGMLMRVLMFMLMAMDMLVFVRVRVPIVSVLVSMSMLVFVLVQVSVLVLSLHFILLPEFYQSPIPVTKGECAAKMSPKVQPGGVISYTRSCT